MIPKVIHYCWFGGNPKSTVAVKCIESWKRYCPDYEIKEWNESNYDVKKHPFMKKAYEKKKWAFVSDYARVDVIHQYGGVYLDTDVELIASINPFLEYDFYAGFESASFVAFGLGFGAIEGHPVLRDILDYYDKLDFPENEFGLSMVSCPRIQTKVLEKYGLECNNETQDFEGIHIFNTEFFNPRSFKTGETKITANTVSIHHYDMSWTTDSFKKLKDREWKLVKIFGPEWGKRLSMIVNFPSKLMERANDGTLVDYFKLLAKRNK